ncbi:MAG: hypothetical protein QXK76_02300 [Candidatus Woesearchaeota archaeon]
MDINKLTNYDVIELLKKNIQDKEIRGLLEGTTIISTPLNMNLLLIENLEYYNDPTYKFRVSDKIKSNLYNSLNKNTEEITDIINNNIHIIKNTPKFPEKIRNAHENLYLISIKLISKIDLESQLSIFCCNLGNQVEKRFKKFYKNKGYVSDSDMPRNIKKYLRSEFEFYTRIVNELYQKIKT